MIRYLFVCLFVFSITGISAQKPYSVLKTDADRELIPEGIAIDSRTHTIYISSINKHKIVAVNMKGKSKDFIPSDQDGFLGGLGMTIDTVRNWIWALSILEKDKLYFSKVHAFDLKTGKTMQQYLLKDTSAHLLNDLAIHEGKVYCTDTYHGAIYQVDPAAKQFGLFVKDSLCRAPNGIVSAGNQLIIATYVNGPVTLDPRTKSLKKLGGIKDTVISYGLDGLVLHDHKLSGVYNMSDDQTNNLIVQYTLNDAQDSVVAENLLDKGNPFFHEPTTIAYNGGRLYALANSHIGIFNKNKSSTKGVEEQLFPVAVIVYPAR
jgi:hypothetical protein